MKLTTFLFTAGVTLLSSASFANTIERAWDAHYKVESIDIPNFIDPQLGGLTWLKNGKLAAAFHSGQIAIYDPTSKDWQVFAKGLHEPLGLVEEPSGALVLMQTAELTRLVDEDKDGAADYYQTLSDDFGLSGNYHEFAFGPAVDSKGNFYVALNVASNYAGIYQNLRGEFSELGLSEHAMKNWQQDKDWGKVTRHKAGRMFSKVPYRGWVMKVTPEGKTIPFASGFRSPDGLFVDKNNQLWITDNQGDWLGTSPLYHVEQGKFYGHPASLEWKKGWKTDPATLTAKDLEPLRTKAAALFPHAELANSPTQPVSTDGNQLGLPEGELLIGDMNQQRLIRYLGEEVNGVKQGAFIPFLETSQLNIGNHRFSWDKSGNLWFGKTHLGWAGDEGIRKLSWNQQIPFIVNQVNLTSDGFKLKFSQPVNQQTTQVKVTSHTYHYHAKYGSEKVDVVEHTLTDLNWQRDNELTINLDKLDADKVYTIELDNTTNTNNQPLLGHIVRYTVNELIK